MKALKQNFSVVIIMLVLFFFLGGNFFLFSQEKTGNISGIVTDDEGNPLPGVTIVAWSLPEKTTHTTVSSEIGHFRFSNLPEGDYTVTFSLAGFKTFKKEKIIVQSGQTVQLSATMELDPFFVWTIKEDPVTIRRARGIKVGLKIGMNYADFHGEDVTEMEQAFGEKMQARWGLCAGGFIRFNISKVFSIQPEVLYTMKGAKIESTVLGETSRFEFNLSYLEVPVLVKFMIPIPGNVKPNLYAGPALAMKLSAKCKTEALGETTEEDLENMKNTDFGLIVGAGVDFGKLMVDLRYVLGLTTTSDVADEVVKNGVISISVGYSF